MFRRLLDPKNDFAFKKVFGTEKNKDILLRFLNDMLDYRNEPQITEVTLQQTILAPEANFQKKPIVDVLCKDAEGNEYIVEMQVNDEKDFGKRAEYYASRAFSNQLIKGGKYNQLKRVIFIAILDFKLFPDELPYKSEHLTTARQNHVNYLTGHTYVFLELEKFPKKKGDLSSLTTMIEKWAYFFKYAEETEFVEWERFIATDQILAKAYSELDRAFWDATEMIAYEAFHKQEMDYEAQISAVLAKGEAKGRVEGEAEGEVRANTQTACNLLAMGLSVQDISKATGLSAADVERLKK